MRRRLFNSFNNDAVREYKISIDDYAPSNPSTDPHQKIIISKDQFDKLIFIYNHPYTEKPVDFDNVIYNRNYDTWRIGVHNDYEYGISSMFYEMKKLGIWFDLPEIGAVDNFDPVIINGTEIFIVKCGAA